MLPFNMPLARAFLFAVMTAVISMAFIPSESQAESELEQQFEQQLVSAAIERTRHQVTYDGTYRAIAYPGGDVPANIGVCSDVVVRSYRSLGVDLQQLVHEDMKLNFDDYPSQRMWGLSKPDTNIDHRRVPNLQAFFSRHGEVFPISDEYSDYKPGDIVTWMLPGNLPHIGIVTDQTLPKTGEPLIVHNIGHGPQLEDMLFDFEITGHYRFDPQRMLARQGDPEKAEAVAEAVDVTGTPIKLFNLPDESELGRKLLERNSNAARLSGTQVSDH